MKIHAFFVAAGLLLAPLAHAQSANAAAERFQAMGDALKEHIEFGGIAEQQTAYRVSKPREFTKIRQNLWLHQSGDLNDNITFYSKQRISYDAVFGLTGSFPETVESDEEFEVELRETYLDMRLDNIDLRIGKQQIVWGEAAGLFFADVVNAKDLREFILQDFDRIRIPEWALSVETTVDDIYAQMVWIPVLQFNRLGVSGSAFEFPLPVPPGAASTVTDPSKPPSAFDNGQIGGRLGTYVDGWDLGVFYLYGWDKNPIPFRSISGGTYVFRPGYRRAHYFGATFSKAVDPVVLRGEFIVNPDTYLATFDPTDADGIIRRPVFDYILGMDYPVGKVDLNFQFMQRLIPNYSDPIATEHRERTHVSVRASQELLDGKLVPEILAIAGFRDSDLLLRPALTYHAGDRLKLKVGADVLQGDPMGYFGRFDHQSRVYTEVAFYF